MSNKSKVKLTPLFLSVVGLIMVGGVIFYLSSPVNNAEAKIYLNYKDADIVGLGKNVYAENCASCHGIALEGQANWRQRDADGYLLAPPHDETGHTWHHSDSYLFLMTKYDIIAVLSYIKSTWPSRIQHQHNQLNARANSQ